MKAIIDIDMPNFEAFKKGEYDSKKNLPSYFKVKKGEVLSEALKKGGYSKKQIADAEITILKGNTHWLELEGKDDKKKEEEAKSEKETHDKRFKDLKDLNKDKQVEMLTKLKVENIPKYEGDRIRLIMKLEKPVEEVPEEEPEEEKPEEEAEPKGEEEPKEE